MTSPTGCDLATPFTAAAPVTLAIVPPQDKDGALSFEALLNEQTEAVQDEPGGSDEAADSDNEEKQEPRATTASLLFPLFTPLLNVAPEPPPEKLKPAEAAVDNSESALASALSHSGERPAPELASTEQKLPLPFLERAHREQIAENPAAKRGKTDGMPGAQQSAMVFTTSNYEEAAAAEKHSQQSLGFEYLDAPGFEQPLKIAALSETEPSAARSTQSTEAENSALAFGAHGSARLDRDFSLSDTVAAVEQAHRVVTKSVTEIEGLVRVLHSSGHEKLEVIVRPEPGTELYLQITKSEGLVHVQARCERGDFAALDSTWTHIQSSLAAQGIRVESLQTGSFAGSANQFGGRDGAPDRRREPQDSFPIHLEQDTPPNSNRTAATPHNRRNRGWQRWA